MVASGHWALIAFKRTYQQQMRQLQASGQPVDAIKNPLERPLRLGCIMLPRFAGLPPGYRVSSRSAAINARSPRREEALQFLQYLAGPVYSKLINQEVDALPGNPEHAMLGVEPISSSGDLARVEMHKTTIRAVHEGAYSVRQSPFLFQSDVSRILKTQVGRLESKPDSDIDSLLRDAQAELDRLISRSLTRNPTLQELWKNRAAPANPAAP